MSLMYVKNRGGSQTVGWGGGGGGGWGGGGGLGWVGLVAGLMRVWVVLD